MGLVKRGGKKNRKHNRNRTKCQTYGLSKRLERRKVANLMRCCGFKTKAAAAQHWHNVRQRRFVTRKVGVA